MGGRVPQVGGLPPGGRQSPAPISAGLAVECLLLKQLRMQGRSSWFLFAFAIGGCGLGGVGDGGGVNTEDDRPVEALCQANLTLSGTPTPPGTPPTADLGCVPEGTWTVEVTISDVGDCGDVPMGSTYTYTVTGAGRDRVIAYTGGTEETTLSIHAGGNGQCEGSFEHIWETDGGYAVGLLKPWFDPGTTTIQGTGTYQLWSEHP